MASTYKFYRKFAAAVLFAVLLPVGLSACASQTDQNMSAPATPEQAGIYDDAIAHFTQLTQDKPGEIEAWLGLARNLRWAGQPVSAAEVLQSVGKSFDGQSAYLAELGKARIAEGRISEGVTLLDRATALQNDDWRLYSALGIGNDYLGQYPRAQDAYKRALELCPDDPAVMNNMAISQALSGQVDRAILTLQAALVFDRHSDKISNNLKIFTDARDLCSQCGARYLRDGGARILAAGLRGTDDMASCLPEPEYTKTATAMTEELTIRPSINIKVYFEFDSAIIRPEASTTLNDLGDALISDNLINFRFQIAGHTDAVGPDAYNQDLSERRANAVLDYLVTEFGIDATRLDTVGLGESQLLDPQDPEGDVNRRVQITRLNKI